ncbi:MAG: gamma-glutamylcyclotransferase [Flavobacterium sp.]|nr:gamma-glutamylcyclotransferase [Pedobacter sp.]
MKSENENTFHYFAYASNLNTSLLEQRSGGLIYNQIQGRLIDYGFRFNKKNTDGSARANIIVSESEDVFGVLYLLDEKCRDSLLKSESNYRIIEVSIETNQGNQQAFTFISDEDAEGIYPLPGYLKTIVEGAKEHNLPAEYMDFIKSMAK